MESSVSGSGTGVKNKDERIAKASIVVIVRCQVRATGTGRGEGVPLANELKDSVDSSLLLYCSQDPHHSGSETKQIPGFLVPMPEARFNRVKTFGNEF